MNKKQWCDVISFTEWLMKKTAQGAQNEQGIKKEAYVLIELESSHDIIKSTFLISTLHMKNNRK